MKILGHDKYSSNTANFRTGDSIAKKNAEDTNHQQNNICKTPLLPLTNIDDEGLSDIGKNYCHCLLTVITKVCILGDFESTRERSRLSKTLREIISDKNALTYFIQYMESRNASHYILCWLDIEAFKSEIASSAQVIKDSKSPVPNSTVDHDSLSVSTDCDSYTADSNSLCDFSSNTLSESRTQDCDKDNSDSSTRLRIINEDSTLDDKKLVQNVVENSLVLFKKYIAQEAEFNVHCSEEMRKEIMESICDNGKINLNNCFDAIQAFVYNVMEKEYLLPFLGTDYFCKYQIDVLTSGNVVLEDILYNETALFYFMEYLEQENQRLLLEFWIAATNFQQQLHDQKDFFDPTEAQSDAVVLYDKYFSLQAHCPLGFSDKVRFAVEQNICGENGLILDCFHLPLKIVENVLEKHNLKPFLSSQLFYKYLSDLINTIQVHGYASNIEPNRKCASDCSSEKSYNQTTFLALEVPQNGEYYKNFKKSEKTSDMTIDTRELYDPNALWKRKKFHRLSLGHVNEIGKYVADFEPEPDRKEFRLKNVFKKVVGQEDEIKKKEEMAWQVAEMIVRDIMNVTLTDQKL